MVRFSTMRYIHVLLLHTVYTLCACMEYICNFWHGGEPMLDICWSPAWKVSVVTRVFRLAKKRFLNTWPFIPFASSGRSFEHSRRILRRYPLHSKTGPSLPRLTNVQRAEQSDLQGHSWPAKLATRPSDSGWAWRFGSLRNAFKLLVHTLFGWRQVKDRSLRMRRIKRSAKSLGKPNIKDKATQGGRVDIPMYVS